jgi:hypothetical protein
MLCAVLCFPDFHICGKNMSMLLTFLLRVLFLFVLADKDISHRGAGIRRYPGSIPWVDHLDIVECLQVSFQVFLYQTEYMDLCKYSESVYDS